MGLSLTWIAVEAEKKQRLLDHFRLEEIGHASDEIGGGFRLAELPGGWVVLVTDSLDVRPEEEFAAISSTCGLTLACEIVETVSFSRVQAYRNGRKAWSVAYGSNEDSGNLLVAGEPPLSGADAGPDTPLALAAGICGYRPGETNGLEWTVLDKKTPVRASRRGRSLLATMKTELVPLLKTLGWRVADRPVLADSGSVWREADGQKQKIWFDYGSGAETYIIVWFSTEDAATWTVGRVTAPQVTLPLWKRFTWKRLNELTSYPRSPEDILGAVIERAKQEIRTADAYLRTGLPNDRIHVRHGVLRKH